MEPKLLLNSSVVFYFYACDFFFFFEELKARAEGKKIKKQNKTIVILPVANSYTDLKSHLDVDATAVRIALDNKPCERAQ